MPKNLTRCYTHAFAILCLCLSAICSHAEQKKTFSSFGVDYDVHYSVVNTTFLTPQVAQAYGITRGKNRAILNISVRKQLTDGSNVAKKALISGKTSDLIHNIPLNFSEIIEQDAIYYIAEFEFNNKDLRRFDISIQPDPNIAPYTLTFSQKIYIELK